MDDKFSRIAFDIGELPENIDLDSPPVTGFDYLYRVRLESKKCPKVVVSNIDTTQFIRHQTVSVDFCNGFIRASPGFEPNKKWQDEQLNLFTKTRDQLFSNRSILKSKFARRDFPKFDPRTWCQYSLGKEKCDLIYDPKNKKNADENYSPAQKKSRVMDDGNPPLLSIILYLSQNNVIRLIAYHADWLEKLAAFSNEQGEWLYALLLCLEKPLDPDTCSLLRRLSRICSTLRSNLSDPKDDALKPLNILMTIVSHYFDQKDMSDAFLNE